MISEKLQLLQKRMVLRIEEIRESHRHRGNIGANVESVVREFLREFLPPYNRIGQGEVIDLSEKISTQLDVVVTNEYHPYLNDLSAPSAFFIEGVACVGEVKSVLTSQGLSTILSSCKRFKELSPKIPEGATVHGNLEDLARFMNKRPYFLFAFESQLSLATVFERVNEFNQTNATDITQQVDGIFMLDQGVIVNFGTGQGSLQFVDAQGKSVPGLNTVPIAHDPAVLFQFLGWLSSIMPRVQLPSPPILPYLLKEHPDNEAQGR